MTELLLIGAGMMGTPYIPAAHALGARVRLVEHGRHFERLRGEVEQAHAAPSSLEEAWAEPAYALAMQRRPDAVLAFSEPQVLAAALLQDRFGLPGPSLHAATLSRNKALQRACLAAHGISQPEFLVTDDLSAATGWVRSRLPVVVKPMTGAGSLGVEYVPDLAAYEAVAVRRVAEGRLLVETAVDGDEYSWEALVGEGEVVFSAVTAKETTGPPGFVEVAHRGGHRFGDAVLAGRVESFGRAVVAAYGVRTGMVHLEFRVGPAGPVLMECAVRAPGDYIMDVLSLTFGWNQHAQLVRLALGLEVERPVPAEPVAYAASYMVCGGEPGRLLAVEGLDEVRAHPAVVRARMRRKPGEHVPALRSSDDRVGHVLICAGTVDQRDEALSYVADRLRVVTATEPVGAVRAG